MHSDAMILPALCIVVCHEDKQAAKFTGIYCSAFIALKSRACVAKLQLSRAITRV